MDAVALQAPLSVAMPRAGAKPFLLSVEPWKASGGRDASVCVMLWAVDDHPQLIEAHQLRTYSELSAWLETVVARCGRDKVAIDWSATLKTRRRLVDLVARCFDLPVPRSHRDGER
jgi:hypothetical protein